MNEELKINIPKGYEIDEVKSTFTNIVFKKTSVFKPETFWFQGFEYTTIKSPITGRIWLDRNLGSFSVDAYGGYFKFGEATCPEGYEVPSDEEWNEELPNASKFDVEWMNIPPAGYRDTNGSFYDRGDHTSLWSSTESGGYAYRRYLLTSYATVNRHGYNKAGGFSVRLIKQ
jgi:hypothetical protein